jgi:hypothetical protein
MEVMERIQKSNFCPMGDFFKPYPSRAKAVFLFMQRSHQVYIFYLTKNKNTIFVFG